MGIKYFTLFTRVGEIKLAESILTGKKLELTQMGVGDGGGVLSIPDPTQTKLINEKRRAPLNSLSIDPANPGQIIAEQVIPEMEGGFWLREIGLYDADGNLIALANCPETYKPKMQEGAGRIQTVRMILVVSSTDAVSLKIDPTVVLATRKYADDSVTEAKAYADNSVSGVKTYIDNSVSGSKTYTDNGVAGAKAYTDSGVAGAKAYTDNSVTAAKAYTDSGVAGAKAYTDNGVAGAKAYTDNGVAGAKAYTDNLQAQHIADSNPHKQYASINSPALTGTPTAPTAIVGTSTTQIATTMFVANAITAASGRLIAIKTFTSSGKHTPTAGTNFLIVDVLGGGGGGGAATSSVSSQICSGGGAGGFIRGLMTTVPASTVVNIGSGGASGVTGGASSFGSYLASAGGGHGMVTATTDPSAACCVGGGVGGSSNYDSKNVQFIAARRGGSGMIGVISGGNGAAGNGGDSFYGSGGNGEHSSSNVVGNDGTYGAGGSGAVKRISNTDIEAGGSGGPGLVIVYEYA
ncbi:phage tail protein [Dickeya dadantii]|uniref:phage tail protein n=1 Tax=Dickeya dadantii TaxID=204038 RepID=UPI001FD4F6B6|nr:phage tail protein [Dickeya dadantii]